MLAWRSGSTETWARQAAQFGYYDHSHLAKDFQAFAGTRPSEFVAATAARKSRMGSMDTATPAGAQTYNSLTGGMPPGSQQGVVLATKDIQADHKTLKARGVDISEIQEMPWGMSATFADPDGNGWVLQQFAE
jgi:predicted enzyme related to lactoylglutathione lyase